MSEAEYFDAVVRANHMLPDFDGLHGYNVTDVILTWRFGAWKITQVSFKDGSYYNVGQPDQGPKIGEIDVRQEA